MTYGMRSLAAVTGAFGLHAAQATFSPVTPDPGEGVDQSIRGALKRALSSGSTGYSAALYVCLETPSLGARAYMLGLSDGDPSYIVLRKGVLSDGIPSGPTGFPGMLRRSSAPVPVGEWVHLRLDAVINTTNDVVLKAFRSSTSVAVPSWSPIAGMADFLDDPLGANSGSLPLVSGGYLGFAGRFSDVGRRVHFARIEVVRGT